ncbi:MAG: 50S ribosomal protein L10 [Solirubrobacterales bacterium]
MNRDQKAATIEEIAAQIEGADAIFAIDYRGISVPQAAELRAKLREADASFRVVKNRLTKLAAKQVGEERLDSLLEGPTALTFVRGDTALAAKEIFTFTRENDVLAFKGGFMDGLSLDEERFRSIARLPARDVLNAQLAALVASPLTGLVRGLGSLIQGFALQLGQIAEQGLVSGDAPSESSAGPVAEEAPEGAPAEAEEVAEETEEAAEEAAEEAPAEEASAEGEAPEAEQGEADAPAADADQSTPVEPGNETSDDETSDSADDASKEEE